MGKRGPKKEPTNLKLVKGNPGKRPLNKKEPKPKISLPSAPDHLCFSAKHEWKRVAKALYDLGLLSELDRAALAAYCNAYGRWVAAEKKLKAAAKEDPEYGGLLIETSNGNLIQNPLVGIANTARKEMARLAGEFGMTPSARTGIEAAPLGADLPGQEQTPNADYDEDDKFFA